RNRLQIKTSSARLQRGDEMTGFDIIAEGLAIDFSSGEQNFGRAKKSPCIVDDAHFFERRGLRRTALPDAQSIERRRRSGQQGRGAMVRPRRRRNEQRVDAGGGKRDRADQPGWPGADNRDFGGEAGFHCDPVETELRIPTTVKSLRSQTSCMRYST